MHQRHRRLLTLAAAFIGLGLAISAATNIACAGDAPPASSPEQIVGKTYRVEPAYYVECHVPNADVDKVLDAVAKAVGLEYGKYDHVAYLDAPGLEQFRPMAGSKAGEQAAAGRVPTTNVSFSIPRDVAVLKKALDAIQSTHSYEEPVVYIHEVWRTRSTAPDDANPNRWWNRKDQ